MKRKAVSGIMLSLLLIGMSTLAFNIQSVKAESITIPFSFSRPTSWKVYFETDYGNKENRSYGPYPLVGSFNITFSDPDPIGVRHLNISKESFYFEHVYLPGGPPYYDNLTWAATLWDDGYGKMYTQDNGDVDIESMTNDTGTFFWKSGTWHPAGEEGIGDGLSDPPGSSWLYLPVNLTFYDGEGIDGKVYHHHTLDMWFSTGNASNNIDKPNSGLDGSYVSGKGYPFDNNSTVTYICAGAKTNIPFTRGTEIWVEDEQFVTNLGGGAIPVSQGSLFPPANLYMIDPQNRSIGTHPNGTIVIDQIPDAFYTGPNSDPERIIVPNPLDGTYEILIKGVDDGNYTFMIDFAPSNITERTKHLYTGYIVAGQTLKCEADVSEGEMTPAPIYNLADASHDGYVNLDDLELISAAWLSESGQPKYNPNCDFNGDMMINLDDLEIMSANWLHEI